MKTNKFLTLMVALAAGSAGAASVAAGTQITNVATATFDNPDKTPGQPGKVTSTSNTVTTVVLPKPSFDITYKSGVTDGATRSEFATTDQVIAGKAPGDLIVTPYVLTNTGNVELTVNIAADQDKKGAAKPADVKYYAKDADTDGNGILTPQEIAAAKEITALTVTADEQKEFFQVVTIPENAAVGEEFGASPEGTVVGTGVNGNGFNAATTLFEGQTTKIEGGNTIIEGPAENTDLQYVKVTLITPVLTNTPPAVPSNPGVPSNPSDPNDPNNGNQVPGPKPGNPGIVVTPPTNPGQPVGTPGNGTPDKPVTPGSDPTGPNIPNKPGYIDPNGPGGTNAPTPIVKIGTNDQAAYPPADNDTNDDTVTFINVVGNGSTRSDQVTIAEPKTPNGVTAIVTAAYINGKYVPDEDPKPGYQVTIPAGQTASYLTKVTYPDNDNSSTERQPIPVTINVTSGLNPNVAPVTATNTIYPPAMLFSDANGTPLGGTNGQPIQVVRPGVTAKDLNPATQDDGMAVFPMDVANTGAYNDSYTLSGTADFNGVKIPVAYYDEQGRMLPKVGDDYITPVVAKGSELKVFAAVIAPKGVVTGNYLVSQKAVSNFSGITIEDKDDIIRVASTGNVVVGKFTKTTTLGQPAAGSQYSILENGVTTVKTQAPTGGELYVVNPEGYNGLAGEQDNTKYQPGQEYAYEIIAKNGYNTAIANFVLEDKLSSNLNYVSATCSVHTDNVGAPGAEVAQGQIAQNAGTVTCTVPSLEAGQIVKFNIKVSVK